MSLTVSSVVEMTDQQDGELTLNSGHRLLRSFVVTFSTGGAYAQQESLTAAAGGTSIPRVGSLWPQSLGAYPRPRVQSIRSRPQNPSDLTRYIVTVEYALTAKQRAGMSEEVAPWLRDWTYDYDAIAYSKPMYKDRTAGAPLEITNSIGEPFDPQPEGLAINRMILITRASRTYSAATAGALIDTTNAAAVTINGESIAADLCRLRRWQGRSNTWYTVNQVGIPYYDEVIEIEVATDTAKKHNIVVPDRSFFVRPQAGAKPIRYVQGDHPCVEPVPLAADGTLSATLHFKTFILCTSSSWTAIGLK